MAKKIPQRSFNDVLGLLGGQRFDVAPAQEGAKRTPNAVQVRKYGCAAEIAAAPDGTVEILARPGWLLNGEIARLLDRGYQKFLKTSKLEIPASADHLRSIHEFSEELKEAIGATVLYNEALGTTSNVYQYDRVKGRD
ncbi:hypothetical protein RBB79_04615 [Tunturiibacter empetritectus]|uniref:Uncharacterized protein n=2 Tax=Tunturiibacter TaxID=3154218 RepID=A0A852VBZ5_9BACT|nr:hypothetical protein [Edaphobacter lichenicola]NYF88801.1 hypothetical protein [Edaphobacter lichenicola]